MSVSNGLMRLSHVLHEGTIQNKFTWRTTSDPGVFRLVARTGYIHLRKRAADNNSVVYAVEVFDSLGVPLMEAEWVSEEDYLPIADLYEKVSARFRNEGMDSIIRELQAMMEERPFGVSASGVPVSRSSVSGGGGVGGSLVQGSSLYIRGGDDKD